VAGAAAEHQGGALHADRRAGAGEPLPGDAHELARRWAETYRYPLASDREDLPQVAQYLVVHQDTNFPRDEFENAMRGSLRERYPGGCPGGHVGGADRRAAGAASAWRDAQGQLDRHAVLAALPLPIFITTAVDTLLEHSLRRRGKAPVSGCARGRATSEAEGTGGELRPGRTRPLVYHLFGRLDARDAMVLTEDDHFDFLIGVTSNRDLIPVTVRRALADTALLFLGFHMEDWNFRVLFRSIMSQQGGGRRKRYAHIAAQIDPEQGRASRHRRGRGATSRVLRRGGHHDLLGQRGGLPARAEGRLRGDVSRRNPYVGPRAFTTGEPLYGRTASGRRCWTCLIAERVVLLHSPSGAGKSSLLHAGLIPDLRRRASRCGR
jgi:hypothetical protein